MHVHTTNVTCVLACSRGRDVVGNSISAQVK